MYCTIFCVSYLCCSSSAKMKGLYTIQLFPWSSLYLLTRWFSLLLKVGSATATPPQSLPPITTLPYPHHSPFFSSLKFFLLHSLDFYNRLILKEFTRSNVSIIFRQKWVFITLQFHETIHLTMYINGSFVLYTYHIRLQPSFYWSFFSYHWLST